MRSRSLLLATTSLLAVSLACAGTAAAHTARHARATAERHILGAPRYFRRHGGRARVFVDRTTRILKTNVAVTCRARRHRRRAHVFVCTARYRRTWIRIRYIATGPGHFRLIGLPHRR